MPSEVRAHACVSPTAIDRKLWPPATANGTEELALLPVPSSPSLPLPCKSEEADPYHRSVSPTVGRGSSWVGQFHHPRTKLSYNRQGRPSTGGEGRGRTPCAAEAHQRAQRRRGAHRRLCPTLNTAPWLTPPWQRHKSTPRQRGRTTLHHREQPSHLPTERQQRGNCSRPAPTKGRGGASRPAANRRA